MKKVLAFLLLLALGALALKFAIGDAAMVPQPAGPGTGQGGAGQKPPPPEPRAPGLGVQQGKVGASVSQRGALTLPRYRTTKLPDGSERHEPLFVLEAKDSQPVREGLQELVGLTVTLFDRGSEAALVTASRAFVELAADANGRPSLREDKELDLRDLVVTALPGSRLEGLRLELKNALLRVGEDVVTIATPNIDDPVVLTLDGERSARLVGKGLRASLPRQQSATEARTEVEILSDVEATTAGMRITSRGKLRYEEEMGRGVAEVHAEDTVAATWTPEGGLKLPGGKTVAGGAVTVRGERFSGWLLRGREESTDGKAKQTTDWDAVQVVGAPASVTGPDLSLQAPQLTVLSGWSGQPWLMAASGGAASLATQSVEGLGGKVGGSLSGPVSGSSPTRIAVALAQEETAALHRSLGFPLWTVRPLATTELVAFDGATRLQSTTTQIDAGDGLYALRVGTSEKGLVARGGGAVEVRQEPTAKIKSALHARGNQGFALVADGRGERVTLGPREPSATHRYALTAGDVTLEGDGVCEMQRDATTTRVRLHSPEGGIVGKMAGQQAELAMVRELRAVLADKSLESLQARGLPMLATFARGGERLSAYATEIEQLDASSWSLTRRGNDPLPMLIRAAKDARGSSEVRSQAPRIELHGLGDGDWLVDAIGDAMAVAHVEGELEQAGGTRSTVEVDAARLRLLPYMVGREIGLPRGAAGAAWLLGEDVQKIHVVHPEHGDLTGSGKQLLLSYGAGAATLFGDPDTATPARLERQRDGKYVALEGAQVRAFRDADVRLQALRTFAERSAVLLPTVTLRQPKGSGALASMQATCRGDIDVLPAEVAFGGPVVAFGLLPDGSVDPEGMQIQAETLAVQRHLKTGEPLMVRGRDLRIDWAGIKAKSAEAELDLRWSKCVLRDPNDAEAILADGQRFVAPEIEVFYDRMEVRCYQGRFTRQDGTANPPR